MRPALPKCCASSVMEPGHGFTQGFAWPTMLFYLLVDVTFGTTAWLTDSILAGIVTQAENSTPVPLKKEPLLNGD